MKSAEFHWHKLQRGK